MAEVCIHYLSYINNELVVHMYNHVHAATTEFDYMNINQRQ